MFVSPSERRVETPEEMVQVEEVCLLWAERGD